VSGRPLAFHYGAKASAVTFSLIESAKENGLKPFEYLKYLVEELPNATTKDLDKYMPWSGKYAEPQRTDESTSKAFTLKSGGFSIPAEKFTSVKNKRSHFKLSRCVCINAYDCLGAELVLDATFINLLV